MVKSLASGVLLLRRPGTPQAGRTRLQRALGHRPPPGGEITGAAGRHEPGTPVAAAGASARARPAGTDLWLVHRGLTADLQEARALLEELGG